MERIVDVTFGSKEAVHRAAKFWQKIPPLKGNFEKFSGVILAPLDNNKIAIRTNEGNARRYEVRPLLNGGWGRYPKAMRWCSWWTMKIR